MRRTSLPRSYETQLRGIEMNDILNNTIVLVLNRDRQAIHVRTSQ
jgi:hypothetical protein